jgi:hypothetical protein
MPIKPTNFAAMALRDPKFRNKIVPSKKRYKRRARNNESALRSLASSLIHVLAATLQRDLAKTLERSFAFSL